MKPVKFKQANATYAKNQPQYLPLPAFQFNDEEGKIIVCWQLSFRERIKLLFTGKLWICLMTFGKSLQPMLPTVNKPFHKE